MAEGGITLLSMAASDAEEPQTLRMVAGAVANLCGNGTFTCFLLIHVAEYLNRYFCYQIYIATNTNDTSSW